MQTLSLPEARRLALFAAGLLKPEWLELPRRASGAGQRARQAALALVNHFGYLQLDTVSIAGARSHALVLYSRLPGLDLSLGEALLQAGEPVFEYWGHEASWLPLSLYPHFEFRRREFQAHPWWGDLIRQHPKIARELRQRIEAEGPLRSLDMEGQGSSGWWDLKLSKKVANALWSAGELAILERRNFQRSFELSERVIPDHLRTQTLDEDESIGQLLIYALRGHGWASSSTLAQTWRLRNRAPQLKRVLHQLQEAGRIIPCALLDDAGKRLNGWILPAYLEQLPALMRLRPRRDQGVLLSPFDPLLWDRGRVELLFNFHQILEIFKPAPQRQYGYYCLPVLAGEQLVARLDLKAHKGRGELEVIACHEEALPRDQRKSARQATQGALQDYAQALGLTPRWP